ncbi:hypothetical protein COLO4_22712 [Corchorus olitorius]|uniref:Uncharacterized protein n=1 Tax=Corchorus olitorius TaxID=93759 RepID=A0A1R3IKG7_9ROSI|nr:hypothetical protein COLO4_22712 [Corchorus olitorius]
MAETRVPVKLWCGEKSTRARVNCQVNRPCCKV